MINEERLETKDFSCDLNELFCKIFTVANLIEETDNAINDPLLGEGWYCILNDVVNDLETINKA